jgi:hypothetical protein
MPATCLVFEATHGRRSAHWMVITVQSFWGSPRFSVPAADHNNLVTTSFSIWKAAGSRTHGVGPAIIQWCG